MKRKVLKSIICSLLIVAMLATTAPAFAASSLVRIVKVNANNVRLRDSNGSVVANLKKGTKLLYWGKKDDAMYKVITSSGKVGYVYKNYLSTYGAMKLNKVFVTTDTVTMYKVSGSSLKAAGKLAAGKYVMVYKSSGGWAYVKTMSGKGAFVRTDDLQRAF